MKSSIQQNDRAHAPASPNSDPNLSADSGLHDAACSAIFGDIAPALNAALDMKGIGAAMAHSDDKSATLVLDIQGHSIELLVFHGNPPRCHVLIREDGRSAEFIRINSVDQDRPLGEIDVIGSTPKFQHAPVKQSGVGSVLGSDDEVKSFLGDAVVGVDSTDVVAPVIHGSGILQNVQEHAPSPAAACSDPQPASERPEQPENKAAGEGHVSRLVRCSSFWVVDGDIIRDTRPPSGIPRTNWCAESIKKAWDAIPDVFRPRAVVLIFKEEKDSGLLYGMQVLLALEGIPCLTFSSNIRGFYPYINSVAKHDSVLVDDVVSHLDDLVTAARNRRMEGQACSVDKLSIGKLQEGSI